MTFRLSILNRFARGLRAMPQVPGKGAVPTCITERVSAANWRCGNDWSNYGRPLRPPIGLNALGKLQRAGYRAIRICWRACKWLGPREDQAHPGVRTKSSNKVGGAAGAGRQELNGTIRLLGIWSSIAAIVLALFRLQARGCRRSGKSQRACVWDIWHSWSSWLRVWRVAGKAPKAIQVLPVPPGRRATPDRPDLADRKARRDRPVPRASKGRPAQAYAWFVQVA